MISAVTVETVERAGAAFDAVLDLWRPNRKSLGLLPVGAFKDCADEGGLLLARVDGLPAGYVAYRVNRKGAVIVHLCVDEAHRRHGLGHALMNAVVEATSELPAVRLSCRQDYLGANRLWPKHGFHYVGDREGRGADRAVLKRWCRQNMDDEPLLSLQREQERQDRVMVAVDANVFMDFYDEAEHAAESQSLLADWLVEDVLICTTAELANEIARNVDAELRATRLRQMRDFQTLEARAGAFDDAHRRVTELLPEAVNDSDASDRRQLAHAVAEQAEFFATRDDTLLRHSEEIEEHLSIRVLRPVDVVNCIYGDYGPESYAPVRLVGTDVVDRAAKREAELYPFQGFARSEKKAAFLRLCRPLLSDPTRYRVRLMAPAGADPIVAYAIEAPEDQSTVNLRLLRTLSHPLTATVLRRLLAEQFSDTRGSPEFDVVCSDLVDPRVARAAQELGFRDSGNALVKTALRGVYDAAALPPKVAAGAPRDATGAIDPSGVEQQFWPLKLSDAQIPSFIVPIQPGWASQLFDTDLVDRELFPPDVSLALALENVYYSGSLVRIPTGARILWYVSGVAPERVGQVRACSFCQETVRGPARDVFRRFRRLGVFRWRHVLKKAGGDPRGDVTAYRFALTERFVNPISLSRVQEVLNEQLGHGNPLAGPASIPNRVFVTLYSEGTNEAA